jgi:phasin family protein
MHTSMNEFLEEQTRGLAELVENLRKSRVAAARKAASESAARIRALNGRVRGLARSGVRLTSVSHGAVQSLIELQEDIVTAAISDAAAQIQRLAETESVRDLARQQSNVLQATRQRIVEDITRAVTILRGAARDARKVAQRQAEPGVRKPRAKAGARAKVKASAKAKVRAPAKRKVQRAPRKRARRAQAK